MERKDSFLLSINSIRQKSIPEMQERTLDVLQKHATSQLPSHMAIEAHLAHDTSIRFGSDCLLLHPDYLAIDLFSNLWY